jgi:hypothetical protein
MKFHISLILLVAALAMSSAAKAHPNECTDSTIRVTFAFTIHGQNLYSEWANSYRWHRKNYLRWRGESHAGRFCSSEWTDRASLASRNGQL